MAAAWVWLGGTSAYLLLAGQVSPDEVAAAIVLGGFGAAWHLAVLRDGAPRFAFERPAARVFGAAWLALPGATLRVGRRLAGALVSRVEGRRIERPFHRGRLDDPRDRGRRAMVVLAASLAPDSYAVSLPVDEDTIIFHGLVDAGPSPDPRWPA